MKLSDAPVGQSVTVDRVGGEHCFRRRLMEFGLVPGTRVELIGVAPLGDPLELLVRGCSLSIRRLEADSVMVSEAGQACSSADCSAEAPLQSSIAHTSSAPSAP